MQKLGDKFLFLWKKHARVLNLGALALGFAFDLWLAKRPDSIADNILLLSYLCIVGVVIVVLNIKTLRRRMEKNNPVEPLFLILLLQFCFGGLASNLLILYGKSGMIGGNFLFIAALAAFALGNEFISDRYEQLRFHVAIYYFLLLTYCIIAVPTFILHSIGTAEFIVSSMVSVIVISIFLAVLYLTVFKRKEAHEMLEVSGIVVCILLVFGALYFLNIIPPVPLSLKQIGVYHSLARNDPSGEVLFTATLEPAARYVFWRDTSSTFTFKPGEGAYCFSAVFAPGSLSTPVVHKWEKKNAAGEWETKSTFAFPINGGREGGYRGYTYQTMSEGQWRCDVLTQKGQLIGRISFTAAQGMPVLSTTTL